MKRRTPRFQSSPWVGIACALMIFWGGGFPSDRAAEPTLALATDLAVAASMVMMIFTLASLVRHGLEPDPGPKSS